MLATQLGSRRPFVETQVFANTLRWLCHAGLGTETETAFSNGFEASARPVRNQIFRELEQFRLRINALRKRAELPERKNASG
jgi:hypothetical protein